MITHAEIISRPYSGEYSERIYDHQSEWNSQDWTFIKFTNDDDYKWCGHFRGAPRNVAISPTYNAVLVLTADYLFQLDRTKGNLINFEQHPQYYNLTVDPYGNFILADSYNLYESTAGISNTETINSPIEMDMIEFKEWTDGKLVFTCYQYLYWDKVLTLTYDSKIKKIGINNAI